MNKAEAKAFMSLNFNKSLIFFIFMFLFFKTNAEYKSLEEVLKSKNGYDVESLIIDEENESFHSKFVYKKFCNIDLSFKENLQTINVKSNNEKCEEFVIKNLLPEIIAFESSSILLDKKQSLQTFKNENNYALISRKKNNFTFSLYKCEEEEENCIQNLEQNLIKKEYD